MAGNNIYVQGSYVDIHDNEVVNLSVDKGEVHVGENGALQASASSVEEFPVAMLVECVDEVRSLFWGDSSMAVIFCVCRDCYNYPDNMSQFERDFDCKAGLLSNTFGDNSFMRMSTKKWPTMQVKQRVLTLAESYKSTVFRRVTKYGRGQQAEDKASQT